MSPWIGDHAVGEGGPGLLVVVATMLPAHQEHVRKRYVQRAAAAVVLEPLEAATASAGSPDRARCTPGSDSPQTPQRRLKRTVTMLLLAVAEAMFGAK